MPDHHAQIIITLSTLYNTYSQEDVVKYIMKQNNKIVVVLFRRLIDKET